MVEKGYLTKLEAVEYTGLSRATIDRLRESGKLKYIKLEKRVLFRKKDIDAFLKKHLIENK